MTYKSSLQKIIKEIIHSEGEDKNNLKKINLTRLVDKQVRIKKEPKSAKPKNDRSQYIPFNKN
jgi:hypothetical protein